MKIMTFNIQHCLNYVTKKIDFETIADVIVAQNPDFVGLNEMRGEGTHEHYTAQTEKLSELTGMKYYSFAPAIEVPNGGPYGNAFLSKIPILNVEKIMIPDPDEKIFRRDYYESRCIIKAELEGGLTALVTHFGLNPDEHVNAVKTVIKNLASEKCILMGDFNVRPDNFVLYPIKQRMNDTADLFDEPKLSFPSDAPDRKIDYIFVSRDIEVVSADIPPVVASDHRPHVAEIKLS